jgi:LysR family nitrogen assimilation transcriptional regulator
MTDLNLTTRQLRALVVASELGNISHAAVELGMSQPTLSRTIARIEADLGVELFERDSSGVRTTDAGERLVARAVDILRQLDDIEDELRSLDGQLHGRICVAMPDTIGHTLFLPILDRFAGRHAQVELRVMGAHPNNVPLALSAGDADVGVASSAHRQDGLVLRPLATEHLHLVSPPDDRPAGDIDLADVAPLPLALPGIQPGLRQLIDRAFAARGLRPNVVIEADSQDTLLEVIRDGRAHSIMSFAGVLRPVSRGDVHAHKIVNPTIDREIATALPRNRTPTRLMRAVEDEIHMLTAEYARIARWSLAT